MHIKTDGSGKGQLAYTAALILFAFLNAICFPLITVGLSYVPPFTFATLRALIAGSVLALAAALLRRPVPREPRTWLRLLAIGLGTTAR